MTTPSILKTSTTAAVTDPVTKKHLIEMAESAMMMHGANASSQKQQKRKDGSGLTLATKEIKSVLDESSLVLSCPFLGNVAAQYQPPPPPPFVPVVQVRRRRKGGGGKEKKGTDENEPVVVVAPTSSGRRDDEEGGSSGGKKDDETSAAAEAAAGAASGSDSSPSASSAATTTMKASSLMTAFTSNNLPPLETAAPARNLCLELLATRVVACIRAVSLLLQEFSSSPGQSLPHVAILGTGNVGRTVLAHLVKLLPPDRIVVLARDSKSEVCTHFSNKYGVRSLSTNILRDERLVEVVRSHRNQQLQQQQKLNALVSGGAGGGGGDASASNELNFSKSQNSLESPTMALSGSVNAPTQGGASKNEGGGGGGGRGTPTGGGGGGGVSSTGASASHVSPEVAAAHNVSVALQQVHVLIVACRPAQLPEVASSLQPWLRSSSVVVLSTLVGVTADRVAQLFRVPSSLSVTVDTNEMLFAFESASMLHAKNNDNNSNRSTAVAGVNSGSGAGPNSPFSSKESTTTTGGGVGSPVGSKIAKEMLMSLDNTAVSFAGSMNAERQEGGGGGGGGAPIATSGDVLAASSSKVRFFTREPLDFIHRLFFALVSTLLERCGVGPVQAWIGVARLMLGRPVSSAPPAIGAQGPSLVSKCSVQSLATAAGLSVGEVMTIIDARMTKFAGVGQH